MTGTHSRKQRVRIITIRLIMAASYVTNHRDRLGSSLTGLEDAAGVVADAERHRRVEPIVRKVLRMHDGDGSKRERR